MASGRFVTLSAFQSGGGAAAPGAAAPMPGDLRPAAASPAPAAFSNISRARLRPRDSAESLEPKFHGSLQVYFQPFRL